VAPAANVDCESAILNSVSVSVAVTSVAAALDVGAATSPPQ
jgi:hypothetical protein